MEKGDLEAACAGLNKSLSKYQLHQTFNLEEFEHWFLPRKDIVYSYVVQVRKTCSETDMMFLINDLRFRTLRGR